ncbi:MAG: arsenate reductase ArsC [Ignavibacteria bacterium]|nr:arsenate reductase ArsC [Ignavibacteria bacterium]
MFETTRKINVLFLCTGNSCRSQMAEGWARTLLSDDCVAYSAGIVAHGINPMAARVMSEAGVDITTQLSQRIEQLPVIAWDMVITVCDNAREQCPYLPGVAITLHHSFDDPPSLTTNMNEEDSLKVYRRVHNEIREFVSALPQYLKPLHDLV